MSELVSVLVPAYNAEQWLDAALRSVRAQTWSRVEVIVVDDGSRDKTLARARSWESASVRVVTQPNLGAPAARNRALELAQGSYIQWLDADDLLHPDKISTQMRAASRAGDRRLLFSGPFCTFYYRVERARSAETALWRDLLPIDYFLTRFNENTCFQTDAWLVSRELTDATGPWTDFGSPDDDGEYFCRMVTKSSGVRFVNGAYSYYRVGNPGSLANRRSHSATTALFGSKVKCIRYLLALEDSPRTRAACIKVLQDWAFHLSEYHNVAADAQRLATELGGSLERPSLKWKYRGIERLFGYDTAFKAARVLPLIRSHFECNLDRLLYTVSTAAVDEGRL